MNSKCLTTLKRQVLDIEIEMCLKNATQTCLRIVRALRHEADDECKQKIFDQRLLAQLLDLFQNIVRENGSNKPVFNSNDIRMESLDIILGRYLDLEASGSGLSASDCKTILANIIIQLDKEQVAKRTKNGIPNHEFQVYCKRALLSKISSSENFRLTICSIL